MRAVAALVLTLTISCGTDDSGPLYPVPNGSFGSGGVAAAGGSAGEAEVPEAIEAGVPYCAPHGCSAGCDAGYAAWSCRDPLKGYAASDAAPALDCYPHAGDLGRESAWCCPAPCYPDPHLGAWQHPESLPVLYRCQNRQAPDLDECEPSGGPVLGGLFCEDFEADVPELPADACSSGGGAGGQGGATP